MKKNQRGSVLVAVLWMLGMLAVFSWAVARQASQELLFGQWIRDGVQGRALARAGVTRAILEVQQDKFEVFDALNESWASNPEAFENVSLQDGSFSVMCHDYDPPVFGLCDESARISVNDAPEELLVNLLKTVEPSLTDQAAKPIAQAMIDWRDTDSNPMAEGAEAPYYEGLKKPYALRNQPFQSVEELSLVRGMTPELFEKIRPFVTVYSEGRVNFNTAGETVLKALGLSPGLAAKVLSFRKGGDRHLGTDDDEVFQDLSQITPALSGAVQFSPEEFEQIANVLAKGWVGVTTQVFRVQVRGVLNRESRKTDTWISSVIKRDGSILMWREGPENL